MPDISNIIKSTGVELEKQAADQFGGAVEDFARGALGFPPNNPAGIQIPTTASKTWDATSYAATLAGSTSFRPKLKFLFKVEFVFKPEVIRVYKELANQDFTFMIKQVDRPKIDFEYEEDVNLYNFRTKALKKIRHRELTMTFMDDVGDRVFEFFRTLMMIHSPITRRQLVREQNDPFNAPTASSISAGNGMVFSASNSPNYADRAHRGVIDTPGSGAAIEVIRVKQIFMDPSVGAVRDGPKMVIFDFLNPRLISFDLDDLNHESSDANLLTMQFDYDWMEMVKVGNIKTPPTPVYVAKAPGALTAPADVLEGGSASVEALSSPRQGQGNGNPFAAIIAGGVNSAITKVTNEAINRSVRSIAGNGIIGRSIGQAAGGLLSSTAGGLIGSATNDALNGVYSGVKSALSRPSAALVSDAATGGPDRPVSVVRSSDAYIADGPGET